jgi:hypothetical protein
MEGKARNIWFKTFKLKSLKRRGKRNCGHG